MLKVQSTFLHYILVLPLQTIYASLETLIIKMYINNGSHIININNYKQTFF